MTLKQFFKGLFKLAWDSVSNIRLKLCDNILNLRTYIDNDDFESIQKFEHSFAALAKDKSLKIK